MKRALPLAVCALAACTTEFDPQYRVTDARILAIRAETLAPDGTPTVNADADAGDTLRLTALVANPLGRSPVQVTWYACLPQKGATPSPCLDPALLADPGRLATATGVLPLASLPAPPAPPTWNSITITVPAEVGPVLQGVKTWAEQHPEYACRLYAELPIVAVLETGPVREAAYKKVRLTPTSLVPGTSLEGIYVPNANPSVSALQLDPSDPDGCVDGSPVASGCRLDAECGSLSCVPDPDGGLGRCASDALAPFAGGERVLCGRHTPDSSGAFNQCVLDPSEPDGVRVEAYNERLYWQWYATAGSFEGESGVGNATGVHVRFTRPSEPFTLWAIVRDGRGGEQWVTRAFPAAP